MTKQERKLIKRAIYYIHVKDYYWEGLDILSKLVGGPTVCDKPSEPVDIRELCARWNAEERRATANNSRKPK